MTIIMKTKNQVTIPKKITNILGLGEGTMFNIVISGNRIELIPLEVKEKVFTKEEYAKLDMLSKKEQGKEKKITKSFIEKIKRAG
ncbi:MAG: AbrB/MazE/SpoVT family DNA-binding domain-containing protein [Candidatus Omnitrophica bacterium]|nr:AbrB/MazE/SpoVT family DNA-binding domain-containing protein [Candidatus Omnitrophota bacterium]